MKTENTNILLKKEEIENLRSTLCETLSKLMNSTMYTNQDGNNQVVIQLGKDAKGQQWLMFIYYSEKDENYYFSYQDQEYMDTDFTYGYDMMRMVEQIEKEIEYADYEWIEYDAD